MSERSGNSPANAGKSSEVYLMNATAEAHALVCELAGPFGIGDRIKTALSRVAQATGLSERRVRGLYHQEARAVLAAELDALRREAQRRRALEAVRHALKEHRARYGQTEALLLHDEEFYRVRLAPVLNLDRREDGGAGALDLPRTEGRG